MVAKKNDESEKKIVKIKASVGAWWKSKAEDDTVAPPQNSEEKSAEVAEKPKTAKPRSKRPARSRKKTSTTETVTTVAEAIEVPAVETEKGTGNAEATEEKPKPKRKGRRPTKAKTAEQKQTKELATTEEVVSSDTQAEAQIPQEVDEATESVTQEKKRRSGRGRRPRRSSRKPKEKVQDIEAVEEAGAADADVAEGSGDIDVDDATTSAGKSSRPTRKKKNEAEEDEDQGEKPVYKLLINAEEPEECRLALLADGRLEEIHVSTTGRTQTKNNIYKARIVALEPSLQAAFVEYGREKNGFLPFSEIHPEYFRQNLSNEVRQLVEQQQWKKLSITDVLERGQEVLAQVVKEEVGKKGANMTTFLSIPGRCVVLMPGSDSAGISRKISGEQRRGQLRDTMKSIEIPEGIGWIVRTASVDINPEALTRDVNYLLKLWTDIKRRGQELNGVGMVYEDQDSVLRFLREHFDPDIEEILVDDRETLEQVRSFIELLPPEQQKVKVRLHQGARPIFNQYSVEDQIESIYQHQVNLVSGGSIVIDPTEALVAIDVNSGSTSKGKNFEASIFQANMEAAKELARQLRLRDLGGLIVVDFIDMRSRKNIQAVEKQLRTAMKKDKAKVDFSRISKFGLMQISRQKLGSPIEASNYQQCEHCRGRGSVRSVETLSLYYLRRIQTGASRKPVERIECHLPLEVASYLLNNKRSEMLEMEKKYQVEVLVIIEPTMKRMDNELIFHKAEKEKNGQKES